ncbi:GNAT family N-acetyltransferase [Sulfuriferula sp. GW1]|uniref:GNAT family N-acetyltransferase n=1 Tax=Sulfuriferula sp. GW1 TaxID=3345111 RepID=UPI0039AF06B7
MQKLIRELTPADSIPYQQLILNGLREHPGLFRISPEDAGEPLVPFAPNNPDAFTLGVFQEVGRLVGVVSFEREVRIKLRHKGLIYRMYVSSGVSGQGIGRRLLQNAINRAQQIVGLQQINLTVIATNAKARQGKASLCFRGL